MIKQLEKYTGEAIIDKNIDYDFEDLSKQTQDYFFTLKNHLKDNDVVIIDADYSFYSIALLLALSQYPCIIVPIIRTTEEEWQSKLEASKAHKTITIDKRNLKVKIINDTQSTNQGYLDITLQGNSGLILFSSGTTGLPKVILHDFSKLINSFVPPKRQKKLKFLLFLMFDHIGGLNTLLACLNNGSPAIIPDNRNPENILKIIESKKAQVLPTSPTFLNLMLQVDNFQQYNLSSLRLITYGTERMPQFLLEKLNTQIPHVKFLQTFGTSETGILKTVSKSSKSLFFKIINEDLDYKIIENQLFIKSKTLMKNDEKNIDKEGWFATGDLVEQDEEDYIKIIGRINDVINVGGQKVLPVEVENVINTIEGVIDSTVYARNNAITGQMVCVDIVIKPNLDESHMKNLVKQVCKTKLDKYKRPVKIKLSQKIDKTDRFKKNMTKYD